MKLLLGLLFTGLLFAQAPMPGSGAVGNTVANSTFTQSTVAPTLVQSTNAVCGGACATIPFTLTSKPTVGHLLVAILSYSQNGAVRTISTPDANWVMISAAGTTQGNDTQAVYQRVVLAGDATTYTFTVNTSVGNDINSGVLFEFANAGPITQATVGGTNSTTFAPPSVTPNFAGSLPLVVLTTDKGSSDSETASISVGFSPSKGAFSGFIATWSAFGNSLSPDSNTAVTPTYTTGIFTTGIASTLIVPPWTVSLSGTLSTTGAFNPTFVIPSSSAWTFPAGPSTLMSTATVLASGQVPTFTGDVTASGLALTVGAIGGKTVSLGGNLATTGAFNLTLAVPSSATWTLPAGPSTLMSTATNVAASQMPALTGDCVTVAGAVSVLCGGTTTGDRFFVASSDFTTAGNTNLQSITGLAFVLPANTARNVAFQCHLAYSQATAAVADSFGIQSSVGTTNIFATGSMQTAATTITQGNLPVLSSTTATAIVTATPSAITTIWNADLSGFIENPSVAQNTINIMVKTATSADVVSVKRGSFCVVQ